MSRNQALSPEVPAYYRHHGKKLAGLKPVLHDEVLAEAIVDRLNERDTCKDRVGGCDLTRPVATDFGERPRQNLSD